MNSALKNLIGIVAVLFLVTLAGIGYKFVASYDKGIEPSSFRSFVASAEGESVAIPDVASFTASVITEGGTDIAPLQEENTKKMNAIIAFLKDGGVEEPDIKTKNYNINPRYQHSRCTGQGICPPPQIVGYSINQTVAVKVRELDTAGDLLAGIVAAGANSASQLSFEIDDPTSVRDEARDEAIGKAQTKAQAIAKSAGFKVGRLLSISESFSGGARPMYSTRSDSFGMGGANEMAAPSIEPGSEEVKVTVSLTYEIE